MPLLILIFRKKATHDASLTFVRADGTSTGQRNDPFFFGHDLAHYAIETVLNLRFAFLGLVADGWDIGDFGSPWPRGHFPPHALNDVHLAEHFASVFDRERASGQIFAAQEVNELLQSGLSLRQMEPVRHITDEELARIRARHVEITTRWYKLPIGATMELPFPADSP